MWEEGLVGDTRIGDTRYNTIHEIREEYDTRQHERNVGENWRKTHEIRDEYENTIRDNTRGIWVKN